MFCRKGSPSLVHSRKTALVALRIVNKVSLHKIMYSELGLVFKVLILACLHASVSPDAQGMVIIKYFISLARMFMSERCSFHLLITLKESEINRANIHWSLGIIIARYCQF